MASTNEVIRCMLLPLAEDYALLPNVTVAEVITYVEPSNYSADKNVLGFIDWRGISVPIISFENICSLAKKESSIRDRIAILYHPDGDKTKPYLGIKLVDIPKSFRAESSSLVDEAINVEPSEFILNQMSHEERRLFIPNLDALFERLI